VSIWFSDLGLVDTIHTDGGQHSDWNILCNNCFSVSSSIKILFSKTIIAERILTCVIEKAIGAIAAAYRVRDDCQRKYWDAISLCEAYRCRRRVDCRL
jgi:hypothetical protein